MAPITETEILQAIEQARQVSMFDTPGVFVISELAATSGIPSRNIRTALLTLKAQGRLEVTKAHREGLDGRLTKVPAYRLLGGVG